MSTDPTVVICAVCWFRHRQLVPGPHTLAGDTLCTDHYHDMCDALSELWDAEDARTEDHHA